MDGNFSPAAIFSVVLLTVVLSSSTAFLEPCDLLYDKAVQAFSNGDYTNVVSYMEGALSSYTEVRHTKVRCRLRCQDQHPFDETFSDMRFTDVLLRRAACMNTCIEEKLGTQSVHKISEDVVQDFHRRIPYNYLQLAYQKLKQPEKAAAAAHTYFQANPEHVEMGQNLEQYKDLQGVKEDHFVDREARPHQRSFAAAVRLYDNGDHKGAIALFEEALVEYYKADSECRALCQWPQKFEGHDYLRYRYSLHELVSDHFTQVLHCEHECVRDLATRPGRLSPMENYLPLHYDYLQFAYFHGKLFKECKTYSDLLEDLLIADFIFNHFSDLKHFLKHCVAKGGKLFPNTYLTMLGVIMNKEDGYTHRSHTHIHCSVKCSLTTTAERFHVAFFKYCSGICVGGPLVYDSVQLVQNSAALNGTQRVLLDHVISEEECLDLRRLAHAVTMAGDGYRGKMSPHTPNEKFEGATVLKTLQYGYEGRVPMRSARLFYDISERARRVIESYFLLNSTLHFSYTHLVCRTAITGQQDHRNDLSHPIHADNCLLDPEANECWKEPPAYTYRDYSALLYLNGDFEGGEFIFTEMDAKTVTASVKPMCGRMVGFSSGGENPHGVKAVTSGQRCAVALWFTLDPLHPRHSTSGIATLLPEVQPDFPLFRPDVRYLPLSLCWNFKLRWIYEDYG
uniref:procollagen-proline 3-dioxygenase n=1 Tax=Sander lucioperca TaxID=283035 RepID=A0A8C9WUM9_SANLU